MSDTKGGGMPCRVCGCFHILDLFSSICDPCHRVGLLMAAGEREMNKRTYTAKKHDEFEEAKTTEELKAWIREYML